MRSLALNIYWMLTANDILYRVPTGIKIQSNHFDGFSMFADCRLQPVCRRIVSTQMLLMVSNKEQFFVVFFRGLCKELKWRLVRNRQRRPTKLSTKSKREFLRLPRVRLSLATDSFDGKQETFFVAVVQKSSSIRRQSFTSKKQLNATVTSFEHLWLLFTRSHICAATLRLQDLMQKSRSQFMIAFSICKYWDDDV